MVVPTQISLTLRPTDKHKDTWPSGLRRVTCVWRKRDTSCWVLTTSPCSFLAMVNYFFTLFISHNVIVLPQNLSFFSLPKPQQSFVRDSSFWVSLQLYSVLQLVGSPCCHLPVVSTQVFRWNSSVWWLYQIIDLLVLMWITTVSWVLTSLLLSVMSLVINTCYYFDLCSISSPSGAFTHRYFQFFIQTNPYFC